MKRAFFFITLLISLPSLAGCIKDFRALQNKEMVKLVKERTIEIIRKRQMKFLIEPEVKAVLDYMELTNFSFDGDNGLAITTEQYRDRKNEMGIGYRISVTDGTEFSNVHYYIKIHEDLSAWVYPILYRVREGRSRVSEFICE
jgi:hypothetical protein